MKNVLPGTVGMRWLTALLMTCSSSLYAQDRTIQGTVTDGESGEPLPGGNVVVRGTTVGTVTGIEGTYTLSVPENSQTLVFSSIGYNSWVEEISNPSAIDVVMMERVRAHHPDAAPNIQLFHVRRPIPQDQIDRTTTEFPQNGGYSAE